MDFTVYLPDELGARAKDELKGQLSRLFRDAVEAEMKRREAMAKTLAEPQEFKVAIEDSEGRYYTGRISGSLIAYDDRREVSVYLTTDERVIVYDGGKQKHYVLDDPEEQLRGWLSPAAYSDAMEAFGIVPVIDL